MLDPYYERDGTTIYVGDNRDVLQHIGPVHAVVADPPYGLSFMGKGWDHSVPGIEFWQAISAAMLPGAHLLAFGSTRTFHRMAVAIEDAGYEIRDTLQWLYGSGFPKSHDVSKAIDKMAGAEREVVGESPYNARRPNPPASERYKQAGHKANITAPATPAAEQWQGWGTALKPAYEPIIMARLPFKGTVAANVLQHGTGAINVDASRIGTGERPLIESDRRLEHNAYGPGLGGSRNAGTTTAGRWPSNVILDEEAAAVLDAQSGVQKSGTAVRHRGVTNKVAYGGNIGRLPEGTPDMGYGDTGGASRFFKVVEHDCSAITGSRFVYIPKASRRERNAGLDGMPERIGFRKNTSAWKVDARHPDGGYVNDNPGAPMANHHPTVKPIALMRYLIQMVTPPGGIVLDPFAGSGSTLVAAAELGFDAVGIELSEEYAEIAARRVDHALNERAKRLPGLEATP